jgi:probable rRNA maturation factor
VTDRPRRRGARLHVTVTDGRGRPCPTYGLPRWLARVAPAKARGGTVCIALVTDPAMRRLNAAFRGVDQPTDVLSFPAESGPKGRRGRAGRPGQPRPWGDLAIARGVAARQAREYGHPVGVELRILALHGLLHLLGYDHETDSGTMRRLEERLRRRARLPIGLVTRAARGSRSSRRDP